MKMSIKSIALYLLISFSINATAQYSIDFSKIESLVLKGDFHDADSLINFSLLQNPSVIDLSKLYQAKGSLKKLEGNIDEAYNWWQKSNEKRILVYSKHDYHLVWNYALLSNYYYEKINTPLAKSYADSCMNLIQNLTIKQEKEIQIYRIWNILAQSIKLAISKNLSHQESIEYYENKVQNLYLKSIQFQLAQHTPKYDLAKTYHLLANSYVDIIRTAFAISHEKGMECYTNSYNYYEKAISLFKEDKNSNQNDIAKSYFVRTFLYSHTYFEKIPNAINLAENDFNKSLEAFGIDWKSTNLKSISKIIYKEDLLMGLKYNIELLFKQYGATKNTNYLIEAEQKNKIAIVVWDDVYNEFQSKNTNQNLAIYNLIPFQETIKIELLKKDAGLDWSIDNIFSSNQILKYYDLNKGNFSKSQKEISITKIQNKLSNKELFLDFFIVDGIYSNILITKDSVWLHELPQPFLQNVRKMNSSILNFDFKEFASNANNIYNHIFKNTSLSKMDRLIICSVGDVNTLPFEALLISDKNVISNDYRKLDYLINHVEIEYCLSPLFFRNSKTTNNPKFEIDAFAPFNKSLNLSQLPFSEKLAGQLSSLYGGKSYIGEKATLNNFLNSSATILHLSSHGLIDKEQSYFSALVMSDTTLLLNQVYEDKLRPKLVVLNTCNSSLGKYYIGDGIDGFVRAFHATGVANTLTNSWEVDDKMSNQLLNHFYKSLSEGNSTIKALQLAKIEVIKSATNSNLASPYYWAGHQVIGNELIFEVENDNYLWFWLLGFVGLIIVVYVFLNTNTG